MPALPAVRRAGVVVAVMCAVSGCGGSAEESVRAPEPTASTEIASATEPPPPTTRTEAERATTTDPPVPPPTTAPTTAPSPTPTPTPEADCRRVEEFGPGAAERWIIVDDGVMGGRSQGNATIADDAMRFAGLIETEGGGFSSVRALVAPKALAGATELRFRARSDGRAYELIADDVVAGRDGRVSHFGRIPLTEIGTWEEVSVSLTDLESRIFGTPVDDVAFDPALATSIGVILADSTDGPFELAIDWIDACR